MRLRRPSHPGQTPPVGTHTALAGVTQLSWLRLHKINPTCITNSNGVHNTCIVIVVYMRLKAGTANNVSRAAHMFKHMAAFPLLPTSPPPPLRCCQHDSPVWFGGPLSCYLGCMHLGTCIFTNYSFNGVTVRSDHHNLAYQLCINYAGHHTTRRALHAHLSLRDALSCRACRCLGGNLTAGSFHGSTCHSVSVLAD